MMTLREQRLSYGGGGDSTVLRVDNPDLTKSAHKAHGLWILGVSAETRDKVIEGVQRGVESGVFTSALLDVSPNATGGPRSFVYVMEEGYVTRRTLKTRLEAFERMGLNGGWFYIDTGAQRHKSARRVLCGNGPRPPVTELDYRGGGDEPVEREAHLPKK